MLKKGRPVPGQLRLKKINKVIETMYSTIHCISFHRIFAIHGKNDL